MIFKVLISNIKEIKELSRILTEVFGEDRSNVSFSDEFTYPFYIYIDFFGVAGGGGESFERYIQDNALFITIEDLYDLFEDKRKVLLYESDKYICLPKDEITCSVDVSDLTGNTYDRIYGKGHQDTNNGDGTLLFDLESVNFDWGECCIT